MLEPYFFRCPSSDMDSSVFRVTGYSRYQEYTLIYWAYGADPWNYATGQTLYRGQEVIASGGGTLSLYSSDEDTAPPSLSVWDRVDSRSGVHGVSNNVADALTDMSNRVIFDLS